MHIIAEQLAATTAYIALLDAHTRYPDPSTLRTNGESVKQEAFAYWTARSDFLTGAGGAFSTAGMPIRTDVDSQAKELTFESEAAGQLTFDLTSDESPRDVLAKLSAYLKFVEDRDPLFHLQLRTGCIYAALNWFDENGVQRREVWLEVGDHRHIA